MTHTIEFYEYDKKVSTLTYFADGVQIDVTGEFYISRGILHHTHIFDDESEMELKVLLENTLDVTIYPSNIVVTGYDKEINVVSKEYSLDGLEMFCEDEDEAVDYIRDQIINDFDRVDEWSLRHDLDDLRGAISNKFEE